MTGSSLFVFKEEESNCSATCHEIESSASIVGFSSWDWSCIWSSEVVALHQPFASSKRHLPNSNCQEQECADFSADFHPYFNAVSNVPASLAKAHPQNGGFR